MAHVTLAASEVHANSGTDAYEEARRPEAGPRIGELDGIRAVAIWMVLLMHAFATPKAEIAARAFEGWRLIGWTVLAHGWLGVDLFFVLSGFLITGILLDTRTRSHYYGSFYMRRALRILPIFLLVLAGLFIAGRQLTPYFGFAILFCANFAYLFGIATPGGAGPMWSLAVEEQFYLIWPTLVRYLPAWGFAAAVAAVVVAEPLVRAANFDPDFTLTWTRCDGLALGALTAIWVRRPRCDRRGSLRAAIVALAITNILIFIEWAFHSDRISSALRISEADLVFAAAILTAYTLRGSRVTAFLRSRVAVFFADTSYCAYLIHVPLFNLIDGLGLTSASSPIVAGLLRAAYGYPLVFALAAISRRWVEVPILRLKATLAKA